jgi:hypothetical protein
VAFLDALAVPACLLVVAVLNTPPTIESVRAKLERGGALFASDEVRLLAERIDELHRSLVRIHTWCGNVLEYGLASDRGRGLIEDAYTEAGEQVRL